MSLNYTLPDVYSAKAVEAWNRNFSSFSINQDSYDEIAATCTAMSKKFNNDALFSEHMRRLSNIIKRLYEDSTDQGILYVDRYIKSYFCDNIDLSISSSNDIAKIQYFIGKLHTISNGIMSTRLRDNDESYRPTECAIDDLQKIFIDITSVYEKM